MAALCSSRASYILNEILNGFRWVPLHFVTQLECWLVADGGGEVVMLVQRAGVLDKFQ